MAVRDIDLMVISPHLDDAVLSLGALIARHARSAKRTMILTVFAGDPGSHASAGGWDSRGGFATEGEAARARRLEDRDACKLLGAQPSWLPFSEADYRDGLDSDAVWSAVARAVLDAAPHDVLVPGFPLTNPDHAWLAGLLVERGVPCRRLGLYAEQPYRFMMRHDHPRPVCGAVPIERREHEWVGAGADLRDVRTKRRAILAYRSQIPLLGLSRQLPRRLDRMLLHETRRGGEAIAWLPDR